LISKSFSAYRWGSKGMALQSQWRRTAARRHDTPCRSRTAGASARNRTVVAE
jgi:hypothetical protein